jgi:hypothetical protein
MRPLIMRVPLGAALLGTVLSMSTAAAQSAAEPSAPATAKRRSGTGSTDGLFENGPSRPNALAEARRAASHRAPQADSAPPTAQAAVPPPPAAPPPLLPTVQAVPPGPPQKNLTGEEFTLIRVGSTEKEVLAVLGPPSSQVVVPDDDGHLRESFQYWVKGKPMGTVRMDNGRVIQIETSPK